MPLFSSDAPGRPGVIPFIIGLLCAFVGTEAGRKLAAHVIFSNMRKLLLRAPLKLRRQIVRRIFTFSIPKGRLIMKNTTHPYGYQWDSITPVKKANWSGYWIAPDARRKGTEWVESTTPVDTDLVIMYIHGGGFRLGDALMYTTSFLYMIEKLQKVHGIKARVLSVEYGLAPEHKWPQQRLECEAAYGYLVQSLNVRPSNIVLAGDSAGGNLVATTLLSIRDQLRSKSVVSFSSLPLPMPSGAILISPWATLESTAPTFATNYNNDCLPVASARAHLATYTKGAETMTDEQIDELVRNPDISPLYADFTGLCPVLVTVGGVEIFRHDIETMVSCLQRDGVQVDVLLRHDAPHVWAIEPTLSPSKEVWEQGMESMLSWLTKR